jgi:hypothetical protein
VVVGATIAAVIILYLLERRADRDLIERRMRALLEYHDCLGDLEGALGNGASGPAAREQAWQNVAAFCRRFRLTGWILPQRDREALGKVVADLEREGRAGSGNGALSPGGSLPRVLEHYREVDRLLRRGVERQMEAHRRFRFLPEAAAGEEAPAGSPAPGDEARA